MNYHKDYVLHYTPVKKAKKWGISSLHLRKLFAAICLLYFGLVQAGDYDSILSTAQARCEQIPALKSQSGLLFNPDGFRSYYERSACYQKLAINFRDAGFCDRVWRRYALFSSSWGYSEKNCRRLVDEAVVGDEAEIVRIRDLYDRAPVQVVNFQLQRNGNGRDFDLVPRFSDGSPMGYTLEFWLLNSANEWVAIYSQGVHLGSAAQRFSFYIRKSDILAVMPEFDAGHSYQMALDLSPGLPSGRGNTRWPEAWLGQVWPEVDRKLRFTRKQGIVAREPGLGRGFR